jgi:hypothetical protein
MKIHSNATLTGNQRKAVQELYATGNHTMEALAVQFRTSRKTISKWAHRDTQGDRSSAPKSHRRSITPEFEQAVAAYRGNEATSHHGPVRIARELSGAHPCSNPSNAYLVLQRLKLTRAATARPKPKGGIPVGKHRTQMDVQQLPAIEGGIHLSTRVKYSEIHDNYETGTIAKVYENALERLPPFS